MAQAQEKTVLIIDDSGSDVAILQRAFAKFAKQHCFQVAHDAPAALAYLADDANPLPDLILLDVKLPGIPGLELLKVLKGDPRVAHIPVVMLSGMERIADTGRAYELGAASYLCKPISFDDFRYTIAGIQKRWLS